MLKVLIPIHILLLFCIIWVGYVHAFYGDIYYAKTDIIGFDEVYKADYLNKLEKDIILEMNKVRTNPSEYAESKIKPMLKRFIGKKYIHKNMTYVTKEGAKAVEECYKVLYKTKPSGILYPDEGLSRAAYDHLKDQGRTGTIGHIGSDNSTPLKRVKRYLNSDYMYIGENISYGLSSSDDIVTFLLINDGMPSRNHREVLLNPKFNLTGVACGYHKIYEIMCVIVYGKLQK